MTPQNLKKIQLTVLCFLVASSLTVAGCNPKNEPSSPQPEGAIEVPSVPPPVASNSTEAPSNSSETSPDSSETPSETPSETSEAATTPNAELPASVEAAVLQDIASSQNVPVESLKVIEAQSKSWPDGCLGLGGPDDICTFALVDGWQVTVSSGDQQWIYRSDGDGLTIKPEA
jgi:cytoskeletal protein RodZ